MPNANRSPLSLPVLRADVLRADSGANQGDTLSFADELMLDDTYVLTRAPDPQPLVLRPDPLGSFTIARTSKVGAAGATVHLDSGLTWMSPDGQTPRNAGAGRAGCRKHDRRALRAAPVPTRP